jgi:hypothetical protein
MFKVLSSIPDDDPLGGVSALLLWATGIFPHDVETVR